MSDTPQEEDYPVGSKITCDEYALVLLMRRSGLLRPLHYIQNIPLTNQELVHVLECKACTLGRSGGNYSLDQMAMRYLGAFYGLTHNNWTEENDSAAKAQDMFTSRIDYVRICIVKLLGFGFVGINQSGQWRCEQLHGLLEDPSFEVREAAVLALAEVVEFRPELRDSQLQALFEHARTDPKRRQLGLGRVLTIYHRSQRIFDLFPPKQPKA